MGLSLMLMLKQSALQVAPREKPAPVAEPAPVSSKLVDGPVAQADNTPDRYGKPSPGKPQPLPGKSRGVSQRPPPDALQSCSCAPSCISEHACARSQHRRLPRHHRLLLDLLGWVGLCGRVR